MAFLGDLITTFIYQPFFNLLVYIYLVLDKATAGQADMGLALIIFTVIFRIIILPLSLAGDRSEKERREISQKLSSVREYFRDNPTKIKRETRKILAGNKRLLTWEALDVFIQLLIIVMLWRIFSTGLEGADFHRLYSFMPAITEPFNLMFLGRFDLSQPSLFLNIVSSLVIFIAEFLSIRFSPLPISREDRLMLAVLPLGAFTYFAFMPAGKKLFVIATLLFSILLILAKQALYLYHGFVGSKGRPTTNLLHE